MSTAGVSLLFSNPFSPSNFRMLKDEGDDLSETSFSLNKQTVLPKFLPPITSPQESRVNHGQSLNSSFRKSMPSIFSPRNNSQSIQLQQLNEKGFNTVSQSMALPKEAASTDKVFKYRPPGETGGPKSAHDKLNLMIVRGQDPSSFIEGFNSSPDPKKMVVSAEKPSALQLRLRYVGQQHE